MDDIKRTPVSPEALRALRGRKPVDARGPGAPTSQDRAWGQVVAPQQEGDLMPHFPGPERMSPAEKDQAERREKIRASRKARGLPGPRICASGARTSPTGKNR